MADNYLQFSETLDDLTAEEEAWLKEQLAPIVVFGDKEFLADDPAINKRPASDPDFTGPRFLRDNPAFDSFYDVRGFEIDFIEHQEHDGTTVRDFWVYAEAYGAPDHVAWLIQKFLKRFRPDQYWTLTYANTCSKPRVGEFGGGAVFVTTDEIDWQNDGDLLDQQMARFKCATPSENNRWVLYDLDANALVGTQVYSDRDQAVEDAAQANDILVLPLVIQSITA